MIKIVITVIIPRVCRASLYTGTAFDAYAAIFADITGELSSPWDIKGHRVRN